MALVRAWGARGPEFNPKGHFGLVINMLRFEELVAPLATTYPQRKGVASRGPVLRVLTVINALLVVTIGRTLRGTLHSNSTITFELTQEVGQASVSSRDDVESYIPGNQAICGSAMRMWSTLLSWSDRIRNAQSWNRN
jgi:hypothetical protein